MFSQLFCNVVPNRCHNVFTMFFVTLLQNVLQTLRKLSKKARINVLPKRFHNQIKTLSQRFHNVFFVSWGNSDISQEPLLFQNERKNDGYRFQSSSCQYQCT